MWSVLQSCFPGTVYELSAMMGSVFEMSKD